MSHPTRLLLLDSGAFSVWTQGAHIDLDDYISFCEDFPDCSYYVNLDVIPGTPGKKASLTQESVEASCKAGWVNYKQMIDRLGMDKVIPVYHQGDPIKWLDKYLSFGVQYIGISPANDRQTSGSRHKATFAGRGSPSTTKLQWIKSLRQFLFDGAGRPLVKTHGFAVTSYDLMKSMEWYSVDSASWKLAGAWGEIYVPHSNNFTIEPEQFRTSANFDPKHLKFGHRVRSRFPDRVDEWLKECKVPRGEYEIKKVREGYKLSKADKEIWFHKKSRIVLVPTEHGVTTSVEQRLRVNAEFIHRANKALKKYVRHIYFAGAMMPYELEHDLGKRLLSYYHTQGKGGRVCLEKHCQMIRDHKEKRRED
jgi:hypothetical protein